MRSRLTLLVGVVSAIVLVVAAVIGPDRVEQSLVSDVIDDAAVDQLVVFGEVVFDESSFDPGVLELGEALTIDPFGDEGFDAAILESETIEARSALLDLDDADVLDDLLRAVRSDRDTGVPVVLTTGHLALVAPEGEPQLLEIDLEALDSPVITIFTLFDVAFAATGPSELDQFDAILADDAAALASLSSAPRLAFDSRELGGVDFVVGADVSDVDRSVDRVRSLLWIATPIVVLSAMAITWLFTGRALRPVGEITDQVSEIRARTLHERVSRPATGDEIEQLAVTMNSMLDRLEADDRRLRQFVADASHELRTPVAVLRSEAEVALRRPDDTAVIDLANGVLAESLRLQQVVDDLLTLARHDERSSLDGARLIDLDEIVIAEAARSRALPIDVTAVSAGRVRGFGGATARAVAHLLDNAVRHANATVAVALRTEPDGSVVLIVDDDGSGIAPDQRNQVFERFTRLEAARARDTGGAGLGLAVVAATVAEMGGTVEVSESPLGGARFVLRVPASH